VRIKLTLVRSNRTSDDILVTTDATVSVGEVATAIASLDPRSDLPEGVDTQNLTLRTTIPGANQDWVLLPPDATVGDHWVGSGSFVALAESSIYATARNEQGQAPILLVTVLSGPDAGTVYPVHHGTTVIGRSPESDITLNDPMVSKQHARIDVFDWAEVVDLGSANGVMLDGGYVQRARVDDSLDVLVGDTVLRISRVEAVASTTPATRTGVISFIRSPRVEERFPGETFTAPDVPEERESEPFPWLAMIAPLLLGGAMFAMTHNPSSLLFVLLSPLMLVGNFFMQKSRVKAQHKRQAEKFATRLAGLRTELDQLRGEEQRIRLRESPTTASVAEAIVSRSAGLWTRRPEHWSFLNVSLGIGDMPSRTTVDDGNKGERLPEFQEQINELAREYARVPAVPVVDNLFDSGALGFAGPENAVIGLANATLIQLAGLHSPAELQICAVASNAFARSLDWLRWLPHTSSALSPIGVNHLADSATSVASLVGELEEIVQSRASLSADGNRRGAIVESAAAQARGAEVGQSQTSDGTPSPLPAIVLLVTPDLDIDYSRLIRLAEAGANAGVFVVWIAREVESLPAACRTYAQSSAYGAQTRVSFVRTGLVIESVTADYLDPDVAMQLARSLSPVVDAGEVVQDSSDIPESIHLLELLGHDVADSPSAVAERWEQNASVHNRTGSPVPRKAGKLRAVVGSSGVNPLYLDLRSDGPHALVGGTTGSGKSEFLQAWALSMATEYSPDRVSFLFVDYKGGAAFADCVELPHCVGLVTDLSPHLVRRALTSLRAELHHRENLLNRKKAKDLLELEKTGDPECPPALIIVIDEFAALVGEVPEFVDGVVDVAQRGRSLGIHLIMATQRPAGVIRDNLRANTNLRIALRMADESDSSDVVGVPDAGHFDPSIPGRAVAKRGPGNLAKFQSGYAGGWSRGVAKKANVGLEELRFGARSPWEPRVVSAPTPDKDLGPTDQQRLVASIGTARAKLALPLPRRPWLDQLNSTYSLASVVRPTDDLVALGVQDVPQAQEQRTAYFDPDRHGHMVVFGAGGSGKSSALRTLACAVSMRAQIDPVVVYGLDFGAGSLRMISELPTVSSVIASDDAERVVRLLRLLKSEAESRVKKFAEVSASSLADYRLASGDTSLERIYVLLDGFPAFRDEWEVGAGRSAWYDTFRALLADGRQLGIHIAITADRSGSIPGAISSLLQRRIVLRLSEDHGYSMLGVPDDVLDENSPAGRAMVDGLETQLAILGGSPDVSQQATAIAELADSLRGAGIAQAQAIGSMPRKFSADTLPPMVNGWPVLGIGESSLTAVPFEPSGVMLLAGPPASGRTTALRWIVESLRRSGFEGLSFYFGSERSALLNAPGWTETATDPESAAALAARVSSKLENVRTPVVMIIESLGDFLQTPADAALLSLIKGIKRSGEHFLVADGDVSSWSSSWPLLGEVKSVRRGLLLQPESIDGDMILKAALPRANKSEYPPGRGAYVYRGAVERVHIPLMIGVDEI
jgi:S-DNA-T family DNA segregation ATPase FtsK/SpoIIIE